MGTPWAAGATEDSLLGRTPSTITNTLQDA